MKRIILLSVTLALTFAGFDTIEGVRAQGRAYRVSQRQMQQLLRRIETRADRFSNSLENALDRSRANGTTREDEVNKLLTDFEQATDQLRDRFNRNRSSEMDIQLVLQRAALLDSFMRDNRLANRAERDWSMLRTDLDQLARIYNVAWNWNNVPLMPNGAYTAGYDAMTTGTFRLSFIESDDPRRVAENATRGLDYNDRQRITESLVRRLTPPDVMAVERRGFNVTLASSRSPQVNVNADGMEHVESYPNGRASRVRASINGDV
ncbi:MAG: hypothetical protein LC803_10390 [Acidobacteria bacterium]|nr:hypothetical protein [Acidobacteriota bacterium]